MRGPYNVAAREDVERLLDSFVPLFDRQHGPLPSELMRRIPNDALQRLINSNERIYDLVRSYREAALCVGSDARARYEALLWREMELFERIARENGLLSV